MSDVVRPEVDKDTDRRQQLASDPASSAWVAANAGSGKTYVLSRRVIRLLLSGSEPGRILCLTFTKAAAAEMSTRVFGDLAKWTTLDDAALANEIVGMEGAQPDDKRLARARRLFARALETPGGLKIQTIHAFCERLLHQFPLEANVPGHFEVLDDRAGAALQDEALRHVLGEAAERPEGAVGMALEMVLNVAADTTYQDALAAFIRRRDPIRRWIDAHGSLDVALASLRQALGLGPGESVAALRASIRSGSHLDAAALTRLSGLLIASGSSNDTKAAARLAPCLGADPDRASEGWLDFLLTKGEPRSLKSIVTKSVKEAWPDLIDLLQVEMARVEALLDRLKAAACYRDSAAMLRLADAAIGFYEAAKDRRGLLDFEDLIVRTHRLLARSEAAAWVQYKLDRGLDHILVDEAQDTSPRQWQVVIRLIEDFFAGEGAGRPGRSFFAVGDEKQSIFSFQGSVPAWFARTRSEVGKRARDAGYEFKEVGLHLSFRSTQIVLDAVDRVFAAPAAHAGVISEGDWPKHRAARHRAPGRVVVWPLLLRPEQPEVEDWTAPLDAAGADSPGELLAERIATTIAGWLRSGEHLESGAPVRAGGILILTRSRGTETEAIHRALKRHTVPFAGADRLRLTEHIAVMDLLALGKVMLLAEDDLTLAALLKSPLFGLDEDQLYRLAHGRAGSLWAALGEAAREGGLLAAARARLEALRARADFATPHGFFARLLGEDGGRRAFLARLGVEAEEVLDEFLAQALAYERAEAPSLQGFIAWMENDPTDVKRDTDMLRDEVRVMTVHGAKGLEADIVFLLDNGAAPVHASHVPKLITLGDENSEPPPSIVWMSGADAIPSVVKTRIEHLKEEAREEYRRLLYVGMTRARDRLYLAGIDRRVSNEDRPRRWHALVLNALGQDAREEKDAAGNVVALDWQATGQPESGTAVASVPATIARTTIPAWARAGAPPPPAPAIRLAPSRAESESSPGAAMALPEKGGARDAALRRGGLVHRLLQSLPDHPPSVRQEVGERFLAAIAADLPVEWRRALLAEVLAVIAEPRFAPVFAEGSRAEVEIAGTVATPRGPAAISGRLDRLVVGPESVLIIDYKTNRPAPADHASVPPAYVAQLALYRLVLQRLYPALPVRAAILWTDRPALMELAPEAMDASISAISGG